MLLSLIPANIFSTFNTKVEHILQQDLKILPQNFLLPSLNLIIVNSIHL
jgi:hypothetical protein